MSNFKKPNSREEQNQLHLQSPPQGLLYTKIPSAHTPTTTIATDADTATPTETAQQLDRDVITAMV